MLCCVVCRVLRAHRGQKDLSDDENIKIIGSLSACLPLKYMDKFRKGREKAMSVT